MIKKFSFGIIMLVLVYCCKKETHVWKPLEVKVTAYNALSEQTNSNPWVGAWGDTLSYRKKSIAISRDLMELGLKHNTKVMIEGLPGVYLVKDKMGARWKNRIDIFMGDKLEKAKKWGVQDRSIVYAVEIDSASDEKN